jgi:hypothetical protein
MVKWIDKNGRVAGYSAGVVDSAGKPVSPNWYDDVNQTYWKVSTTNGWLSGLITSPLWFADSASCLAFQTSPKAANTSLYLAVPNGYLENIAYDVSGLSNVFFAIKSANTPLVSLIVGKPMGQPRSAPFYYDGTCHEATKDSGEILVPASNLRELTIPTAFVGPLRIVSN